VPVETLESTQKTLDATLATAATSNYPRRENKLGSVSAVYLKLDVI
jgi:hypothetical protein